MISVSFNTFCNRYHLDEAERLQRMNRRIYGGWAEIMFPKSHTTHDKQKNVQSHSSCDTCANVTSNRIQIESKPNVVVSIWIKASVIIEWLIDWYGYVIIFWKNTNTICSNRCSSCFVLFCLNSSGWVAIRFEFVCIM